MSEGGMRKVREGGREGGEGEREEEEEEEESKVV